MEVSTAPFLSMSGTRQGGTRHLPASMNGARQHQIRHATHEYRRERVLGISKHKLGGLFVRINGAFKISCNKGKTFCILPFAHGFDFRKGSAHLLRKRTRYSTTVTQHFSSDKVIGLYGGRTFVYGQNPSIAIKLRYTSFLDKAHAAVHLDTQ